MAEVKLEEDSELRDIKEEPQDPDYEKMMASRSPKASTPKTPTATGDLPSSISPVESDRDDLSVAGVQPFIEEKELEVLEKRHSDLWLNEKRANNLEDSVIEFDEDLASDPLDSEYVPPISLSAGVAIQREVDNLPILGIEEAVLDICDPENPGEPVDFEDQSEQDISTFPKPIRVVAETDLVHQQACIAYTISLLQMANFLQLPINKCHYSDPVSGIECDGRPPFSVQSRSRGTSIILEWFCSYGHKLWMWNSQPVLRHGMQGGDFMLSANLLLSGNNFAKIALLFKFMNMKMVSTTTYYKIQHSYCVPEIKAFWEQKRLSILTRLKSKDGIVALADGRMDSPGHSATFCTYTTMELDTMDIISVVNVDKRQVGGKSVSMEKAAFIKTFDDLTKELKVKEIVTDAHVQIAALMHPERGRYMDHGVTHSLDVWHAAKNLTKRLHAAGVLAGQKHILGWIKDIVNHFWYACQHASSRDEFMDIWRGVLHHVSGVHEWDLGRCLHGPLGDDGTKEPVPTGSKAHVALSQIVLNRRWLKDVEKFLTFRTTSQLESFQNHILMYAGKRFAFSFFVYEARTLLAALDYNHHNSRPAHLNSKGQVSLKRLYSKKSKRYRVHTVKEAKDYNYIPDLQTQIIGRRLQSAGGLPTRRSIIPEDPRALGPVSGVNPPPTSELMRTQVQRGQEMTSVP